MKIIQRDIGLVSQVQNKPMKKIRITIGIPAYNEAENIKILLQKLKRQKIRGGIISEIIVVSDGSTDETPQIARMDGDERLKVYHRNLRLGTVKAQNEILKYASGDILVLLNADVVPLGNRFIENLIKPFKKNPLVGLVGADTISAKPRTWFENVIAESHELKREMYQQIYGTDTIYLCHGRARAFSKTLYRQLNWINNYPEDSFSYIFAIKKGFKFVFASQAKVLFRSPSTFADHLTQSRRFINGRKQLEQYFSREFVRKQFAIPQKLFFRTLCKRLVSHPITTFAYIVTSLLVRLWPNSQKIYQSRWRIAVTSKKVI